MQDGALLRGIFLVVGQAGIGEAQVVLGHGIVERGALWGVEAQGFGVGLDGALQVFDGLLVGGQAGVGVAQVVLGYGIVERGAFWGAEAQGLGEGLDGALQFALWILLKSR